MRRSNIGRRVDQASITGGRAVAAWSGGAYAATTKPSARAPIGSAASGNARCNRRPTSSGVSPGRRSAPASDAAGDWKEDLHAFGIFFRRYLLGRRDAAQILANRFIVGPSMISSVERLLGWLRGSGLGDRESSYALISCLVYIHGFVLWETTPMSAPVARGETARDYLEEVRQDLEGLSAREFPHTVALAGHLTSQGNDDRFAFGLTCLLDGIEAQACLQGG